MFPKDFVTYQNKLFWIYKKVKQSQIKEGNVSDLKELWGCDIVVKHQNSEDNFLLFLREIEELEIID